MVTEEKAQCIVKKVKKVVKNHMREKRKQYTIPLRPSVVDRLKKFAEKEQVCMSDIVEHILYVYLKYKKNEGEYV